MLLEEIREIGREALAEPQVIPVALRDRIAEPLMGNLVRHQFDEPSVRGKSFSW